MAEITTSPQLLTRKQAAEKLAISLRTVDELIARGDLPAVRFAHKCVRIRPSALDYLIEAREMKGARNRGKGVVR